MAFVAISTQRNVTKKQTNKHMHKQKSIVFIVYFFLQINIGEQKEKT